MEMRKLYAAIVGYGNRGQVYADYSLEEPAELGIAAIVDPNEFKLREAKMRYGLSDESLFRTFEEFAASNIACDFVINSTMDQQHYETAIKILNAGYHMLMEKPIVPEAGQLREIQRIANEKQLNVYVCHVLRYTPFYREIKELLNSGEIGQIMSIEMHEHVNLPHYLTSYVRGKWNSESKCGSGFLLAKSCHDLDLMCWLNNDSAPVEVVSMGNRSQFVPEKAPEGATEFCYQCPHEAECDYSAILHYMKKRVMPFLVWDRLDKPLDEITEEEKMEFLKKDIYGKCAYTCGGDIVDRQNAIVTFENGSIANFNLVAGSVGPSRYLHIIGTRGEIEGELEDDTYIIRKHSKEQLFGQDEPHQVHPINNAKYGGHNGGDYAIMHDLVRYMNGDRSSVSITSLEDSVYGHLCVFAAEQSRKTHSIVNIEMDLQ